MNNEKIIQKKIKDLEMGDRIRYDGGDFDVFSKPIYDITYREWILSVVKPGTIKDVMDATYVSPTSLAYFQIPGEEDDEVDVVQIVKQTKLSQFLNEQIENKERNI